MLRGLYKISIRILGKGVDTITSMNNCGMKCSQGRYEETEPLYVEALQIKPFEYSIKEHPDTITFMCGLADLYEAQDVMVEPLLM